MTLVMGDALQAALRETNSADDDIETETDDEPTPAEQIRATEARFEDVTRVRSTADDERGTITARVPSYGGVVTEWEYDDLAVDSTTVYHIAWDDGAESTISALELRDYYEPAGGDA